MTQQDSIDFAELEQIDRQARHRLQDAHRLLVPNIRGLARAQADEPPTTASTKDLPDCDRELFNLQVQLAHADILDLRDSLSQFRNLIAAEIRRFHFGRMATAAYVRPVKNLKVGRSN
jgi:hypothetical protein